MLRFHDARPPTELPTDFKAEPPMVSPLKGFQKGMLKGVAVRRFRVYRGFRG